jgi:hypothetical protein
VINYNKGSYNFFFIFDLVCKCLKDSFFIVCRDNFNINILSIYKLYNYILNSGRFRGGNIKKYLDSNEPFPVRANFSDQQTVHPKINLLVSNDIPGIPDVDYSFTRRLKQIEYSCCIDNISSKLINPTSLPVRVRFSVCTR